MFNKKLMQPAVAVIVDRTTDDVRCNYTPLSGLAFVSIWVYRLFRPTYLQSQTEVCFWWRKSAVDACRLFKAILRVFWL